MAVTRQGDRPLPFPAQELSRRLLAWYGQEGRDLPWRQTRDPYRIWLSEIMLQQTTVATVLSYYERFLTRFPTLVSLAEGSLDDVIALWAGLGYYSRARNLHKTARQLVEERNGEFPDDLEALASLPGIGRSTAGAILSIAFDTPAPILDGNVRRVLVRLFAWQGDPRSRDAEKQLWAWAEALTSQDRPHDYAQAIMDLGAMVCTPQAPSCEVCPLITLCAARAQGLENTLPARRKKARVPVRCEVALLLWCGEALLVRQRPPRGLLGGLWEFPVAPHVGTADAISAAQALLESLGGGHDFRKIGVLQHAYSHFKLLTTLYSASCLDVQPGKKAGYSWCSGEDLGSLPLHGAHRKALELFLQNNGQDLSLADK